MKKYILLVWVLISAGCATYNPDVLYPVTNLNEFYKQCKSSETLTNNSRGSLSLSDRFYCLGFVQAASESAIFQRKQINDISPRCRLMVSDFYYELLSSIERGVFNEQTPAPSAFRTISYKLCPKVQYMDKRDWDI